MAIVLVNTEKVARAKEIVALVTGKQVPRNPEERERLENFTRVIQTASKEVREDAEKLLQFIYQKLGGLVRTEEEQKVAEAKAAEIKEKNTKK